MTEAPATEENTPALAPALQRVNRALRALSRCNAAIARAQSEVELMREVCSVATTESGYCMAWIGIAENDAEKRVRPAACAGSACDYLRDARIGWGEDSFGQGPTGRAIRTQQPQIASNLDDESAYEPWRALARAHGFASSIALPLTLPGGVRAALNLYAAEAQAFDAEEVALLRRMTDDLAYGLRALRAQVERDEHSALAWELFDRSPLGAVLMHPDGVIWRSNAAFQKLLEYDADELKGRSILDFTVQEDVALTAAQIEVGARGGSYAPQREKSYRSKSGRVVPVRVHTGLISSGGTPRFLLGLIADLTAERESRRQLQSMSERLQLATSGQGIGVWDLDTVSWQMHMDDTCRGFYGLGPEQADMAFADWMRLLLPEDQSALQQIVERLLPAHAENHFNIELRVRDRAGNLRWLHSSGMVVRDAEGKPLRSVGLNRDVTREHEQQVTVQLQATAMQSASNAMFITDPQGRILWVNKAFTRITGYSEEEAIGQRPSLLKSEQQDDDWYRDFWNTIQSGKVWRGRNVNRRKNGELFDVEQTVTPVRDGNGQIVNYVSIHEDITERVRSEQQIRQLALFDSVTGLPNRNAFQKQVSEALARARRSRHPLAVMLLDLDHFKNINDSLGHAAGDELLAQVAQRLRLQLRESDVAARLGGDEFALLVENLESPAQAMEAAERALQAVRRPYEIFGHIAHASGSIGITIFPGDTDSPETLLKHADLAMYEAKAHGRDRCQYFDAAMDAAARQRFITEAALHEAIENDRLQLVYQPLFRLRDRSMVAVEALLRWQDPQRGAISPAEFVPLAEQCGLMGKLNEWVLRRALNQAGEWKQRHGRIVPVAVNVSASQFEHGGLAPMLRQLLKECQLDAADIELEITESLMLHKSIGVQHSINELEQLGIKLAVDDFGTGYSSLLSLRDYPVSRLKIDASFVRGIGRIGKDEQIIRAVIALAHNLELRVVAEGVETEEQERFLREENCEEVQGYLYARPAAPEQLEELLRRRTALPPEAVKALTPLPQESVY